MADPVTAGAGGLRASEKSRTSWLTTRLEDERVLRLRPPDPRVPPHRRLYRLPRSCSGSGWPLTDKVVGQPGNFIGAREFREAPRQRHLPHRRLEHRLLHHHRDRDQGRARHVARSPPEPQVPVLPVHPRRRPPAVHRADGAQHPPCGCGCWDGTFSVLQLDPALVLGPRGQRVRPRPQGGLRVRPGAELAGRAGLGRWARSSWSTCGGDCPSSRSRSSPPSRPSPPSSTTRPRSTGQSGWRKFWHVTLPMIKPVAIVVVVFSFVVTFADFQLVYVLTRGGPHNSTHLLATLAYQLSMHSGNLGEGAAAALFMVPLPLRRHRPPAYLPAPDRRGLTRRSEKGIRT